MQIFIKDRDCELRDIISKGDFVPTMKEGDKIVLKSRSQFTYEETEKMIKNYKALNILFCGLDSNNFNHVFALDMAKKFETHWRSPMKGLVKFENPKLNVNIHQYELLKILPTESIKDTYMHFIEDNQHSQVLRENIHQ